MIASRVTKRYAQALFKEGKQNQNLDSIRQDLDRLAEIYQKSSEFQKLVDSPIIPSNVKKGSFREILRNKIDPVTFDFLQLLLSTGREQLLLEIIDNFGQILDEFQGILRGEVYSVVPMTESELENLKKKMDQMTGKNVILTQSRDKSLLGGFVVKIDDRVIDASLRNQLNKMGEYLIGIQ